MKKILIFCMFLILLTGCTNASIAPANVNDIKTLNDAFAFETENTQSASSDKEFIYVFELNETTYRVTANMTEEAYNAINKQDIMSPNYNKNIEKIVGPLQVSKIENLNELIPLQSELDKLVGKKGSDLLSEGWTITGANPKNSEFYMLSGYFEYLVTFNGKIQNNDDFDYSNEISDLSVKSVVYSGIGDATKELE